MCLIIYRLFIKSFSGRENMSSIYERTKISFITGRLQCRRGKHKKHIGESVSYSSLGVEEAFFVDSPRLVHKASNKSLCSSK